MSVSRCRGYESSRAEEPGAPLVSFADDIMLTHLFFPGVSTYIRFSLFATAQTNLDFHRL